MSERRGDLVRPPLPVRPTGPAPASATPAALPAAERAFFEQRLGRDFGRVRVFTDESAAVAADALGARAFAAGEDIAFAAGRYQPGTEAGRRILGHELVHVAQQGRGGSASRATVEARAGAAAHRLAAGEPVPAAQQGGAPAGVYCDPDDKKKDPLAPPASAAAPSIQRFLPLNLTPSLKPPLPPYLTPSLEPRVPFDLMSTTSFLQPFAQHGATPSAMGFNMQDDWASAYRTFRHYMSEDLAARSANLFLSSAYGAALSRDVPNLFDRSALDFSARNPNDKRTPVLSVDLLDLFAKKKKRKTP